MATAPTTPHPATEEDVRLIRDAFLECYVRRNPIAEPHPDTSVFQVLEAAAAVLANLLDAASRARIASFLAEDRLSPVRPSPDPLAFTPLETRDGEPHPGRDEEAAWPCFGATSEPQ